MMKYGKTHLNSAKQKDFSPLASFARYYPYNLLWEGRYAPRFLEMEPGK
jgi:hypothetical protein